MGLEFEDLTEKIIGAAIEVHFAIVRSQLRAVGRKHGLLLNFANVKLELKRVINESLLLVFQIPAFLASL